MALRGEEIARGDNNYYAPSSDTASSGPGSDPDFQAAQASARSDSGSEASESL